MTMPTETMPPPAGVGADPAADALPAPRDDWALFLDVDGVLVEIAERPDAVVVRPEAARALTETAAALDGAVALVSGRPIAELDRLFAPLVLPAAGLHGLERRAHAGDPIEAVTDAVGLDAVREAAYAFAADHDGVTVEDKRLSVALHYRRAPGHGAAARALAHRLARESSGRFAALDGKMVAELKPSGADKGRAVVAFMAEPPFKGRVPVFVGDDVTDEDGFAAVNRMGGASLRVGPPPEGLAATAARWQFPDVPAFHAWLTALPAALRSG